MYRAATHLPVQADAELAEMSSGCLQFKSCLLSGKKANECRSESNSIQSPCENAKKATERHKEIALKRSEKMIVAHRGSTEFAPENTLAAYLASLQLGASGNEMDVRKTSDGVLVMFHDDMTDRLLEGTYGNIRDYAYTDLQARSFRPYVFKSGEYGCVPSFIDMLLLHMKQRGLLYIDVKEPGIEEEVAGMLDALDMWDHVIAFSGYSSSLQTNPKFISPVKGYVDLLSDGHDFDPSYLKSKVKGSENLFVADDPRGMLYALGKSIGSVQLGQTKCNPLPTPTTQPQGEAKLIKIIQDAPNWDTLPKNAEEETKWKNDILARVNAIRSGALLGYRSTEFKKAVKERIKKTSLTTQILFQSLDSQEAMYSLPYILDGEASALLRNALWNTNHKKNDWRIKLQIWDVIGALGGDGSEKIALDFLALTDEQANAISYPEFKRAARAYLRMTPSKKNAQLLMQHRRGDVRGATVAELLRFAGTGEKWACNFIKNQVPDVYTWIVFEPGKSCTDP